MSTGKRAFDGKSAASVVAAIMNSEPAPLTIIAPLTPPALAWAVNKCLAKDPEERWQSAGDFASELRWIQEGGSKAGVAIPSAVRSRRKFLRWVALAAALIAGILLGFVARRTTPEPLLRVALNLPPNTSIVPENTFALSPDGQRVVMTLADAQGKTKFWVRQLSTETALPLDDTEGAYLPFWSPDSRFIGFFSADGKVRKIAAGGGSPEAVCDIWQIYGGTWGRNDVIVFATGSKGLYQVSASGGTPVRIPTPEKDGSDFRYPSFLPDGKHILVTSNAASGGIFLVSLDGGEVQSLLPSESSPAQYAEPGYLMFLRGDSLMAQPFNLRTLRVEGNARRLAESIYNGAPSFSTASGGLLVYQRASQMQLTWFDTDGNKLSTVGQPGYVTAPYISPNGKYAMVSVTDPRQGRKKLWLYDLSRGTATPFTFGEGTDLYPAWSPDGQEVAFSSTRGGQEDIYVKGVGGGSQERLLLADPGNKEPDQWSSDGRYILFDYIGRKDTGTDIWALPLFGDRKPFPVVHGPANENWGTFSPDSKWVAYSSDESGRAEVYVVPFPGPGGKSQVSTTGGVNSYWLPGNQFFYAPPEGHIVAVDLTTQGTNLAVGKSRVILGGRALGSLGSFYVSRDGKRWLVALPVAESNASPLILTTNWTAALSH